MSIDVPWLRELLAKATPGPLHIVDQSGQPYGSESRCCAYCGRMCWPGMKGSTQRWTGDWKQWQEASDHCVLPEAQP